jgi:hypothetical protein
MGFGPAADLVDRVHAVEHGRAVERAGVDSA